MINVLFGPSLISFSAPLGYRSAIICAFEMLLSCSPLLKTIANGKRKRGGLAVLTWNRISAAEIYELLACNDSLSQMPLQLCFRTDCYCATMSPSTTNGYLNDTSYNICFPSGKKRKNPWCCPKADEQDTDDRSCEAGVGYSLRFSLTVGFWA